MFADYDNTEYLLLKGVVHLLRILLNKLVSASRLSEEDADRCVEEVRRKYDQALDMNKMSEEAAILVSQPG